MPDSRWILLGASNAARGGLALLDAMRARAGGPVEVHGAIGRGRSYGIPSRLLGRGLSGILASPLWSATAAGDRRRTTAILMDVGNDLFYGVPVPLLLAWIDLCLQRLGERAAEVAVVGIPMTALHRLRPWQYEVFRRLMAPSCRLSLAEGLRQAQQLHEGLQALAARHQARFVPVDDAWYGVDPIHVRWRHWRNAAALLAGGDDVRAPERRLDGPLARAGWWWARPAERTWFGRLQTARQPARRYAEGSTVSLW